MFRQHRSGTQTRGSSGVIREVAASSFQRKDISISSGMVPVFECDFQRMFTVSLIKP
jgi:hypothetical protein